MTNIEKFREVFGFTPRKRTTTKEVACLVPIEVCNKYQECIACPYLGWWNREYKVEGEVQDVPTTSRTKHICPNCGSVRMWFTLQDGTNICAYCHEKIIETH